jgi:hypothetical protein
LPTAPERDLAEGSRSPNVQGLLALLPTFRAMAELRTSGAQRQGRRKPMEASGNRSREQGHTKKRRRYFWGCFRNRRVLLVLVAIAPFATKVVELVIAIIRALK